ncbi:MAG TPA: hypothetical protein VMS71_02560 [Candidatus Acidoferrum sp.]|nr:hypothetical protein [Candidatus Acidoferrum sp.]
MRKVILATALIVLVASYAFADGFGSAFGALTTAQSLGQGRGNLGLGVGLADATSFFGTFTYGLSKYMDGRLKIGFRDDVNTKITLGADFKYQFWNVGEGSRAPFDGALGGFFEFVDLDAVSVFQVGAQFIGSYPFHLSRGGTLSPYGKFNIRIESASYDLPINLAGDKSKTDLRAGLNGGVKWTATPTIDLYGEFQIDGNDGVFFGVDFNVM